MYFGTSVCQVDESSIVIGAPGNNGTIPGSAFILFMDGDGVANYSSGNFSSGDFSSGEIVNETHRCGLLFCMFEAGSWASEVEWAINGVYYMGDGDMSTGCNPVGSKCYQPTLDGKLGVYNDAGTIMGPFDCGCQEYGSVEVTMSDEYGDG